MIDDFFHKFMINVCVLTPVDSTAIFLCYYDDEPFVFCAMIADFRKWMPLSLLSILFMPLGEKDWVFRWIIT